MSFTFFKQDLQGSPDDVLHVAHEPKFGQFSTRRLGHRKINMEWPENYCYKETLQLKPGTTELGHTVTPSYVPYTTKSSDRHGSSALHTNYTLTLRRSAEPSKPAKVKAKFGDTTPFGDAGGITARELPGFKRAFVLPQITHSLRDSAQLNSCNGRQTRLLSVMTNSTPVFVGTK